MTSDDATVGPTPRPAPTAVKRRGPLIPTLVILVILGSLVGVMAQVWTEALWFRQLGFGAVWQTQLVTQTVLFVISAAIMGGLVFASMYLAYRTRPLFAPVALEPSSLERYRRAVEPVRRVVAVAVPVSLGLFAGSAGAQQWQNALMFVHRSSFEGLPGGRDAHFGLDISFYMFVLPMVRFALGLLSASLIMSLIVAVVVHYIYGGFRLYGRGPRATKAARLQIGFMAALLLLLRAVSYWLDRYSLLTVKDGLFAGAGFTDVAAVMPAKAILAGIAIMVAALFVTAAFTGGWRLPLTGVAMMVVAAIVVGAAYPMAVQRFQVQPSQQSKEEKYLQRNIEATRLAYGINDVQITSPWEPRTDGQRGALREDAQTAASIRLLDPAIVSAAFQQRERNRPYYTFADPLDVDRYLINGQMRDTVLAVRELDQNGIPQERRSWVNDKTVFTHGFGVVAAFGNQRQPGGEPAFFHKGVPPEGDLGQFEPRIYFGEKSPSFSIVGAPPGSPDRELDFPSDDKPNGQANYTFQGQGGPSLGNVWNRLLYAVKFKDQNILLSNAVNSSSQILYDRSPRQRVKKVAPWLTLDGDPYPAVIDGRVKWIVDAYTVSNAYPYSDIQPLGDITTDSLTQTKQNVSALAEREVNYIRNSVKATVDAYDGSVSLYTWDETDPILKTWSKVFPGMVKPMSDISSGLMAHFRYPEDLFKVQRTVLGRYHVKDANSFYSGQDFWRVPPDPTAARDAKAPAQPAYYLTLKMPGQKESSFSLTSTYIPEATARAEASVLTGFLAVNADAGREAGRKSSEYGALRLLQLPRNTSVIGPGQAHNEFVSSPKAQQELALLQRAESQVQRGNLLTLPIGGGLLYVQPVYVRNAGASSIPLLRKVLVLFGKNVGFADTLDEALDQVFGGESGAVAGDGAPVAGQPTPGPGGQATTTPGPGTQTPTLPAQQRLSAALQQAQSAIEKGQQALARNDFAAYGEAQKELERALAAAVLADDELKGGARTPGAAPATLAPSQSPAPKATP